MTVEFLGQLRHLDVRIWVEGNKLRVNAPDGVLTPALRDELALRKPEIMTLLRRASRHRSSVVPIQPRGSRPPLFCVPGHNGDVFCYAKLAQHLGADQPFYALEPPGVDGSSAPLTKIEDLAAHFAEEVRAVQPRGPYLLGGYCLGGTVAFELARQLRAAGQDVALLVMFDTPCPTVLRLRHRLVAMVWLLWQRLRWLGSGLARYNALGKLAYLGRRVRTIPARIRHIREGRSAQRRDPSDVVATITNQAWQKFVPGEYAGRIDLFCSSDSGGSGRLLALRAVDWGRFATMGMRIHVGPEGSTMATMLHEPYVASVAAWLRRMLAEATTAPNGKPIPGR